MGRVVAPMSATKAAKLREPGRYAVGDGVHLVIAPNGARSWILRLMVDGKRRDHGLGGAGVTIEQAREKAAAIRAAGGVKPPPGQEQHTFGRVAAEYIDSHRAGWKSAKHAAQWSSTITRYCHAFLDVPVADVTKEHVRAALLPIWQAKHETAFRLHGRIRTIIEWAMERDYMPEGVNAADRLGLPSISRHARIEHHPSLPYAQVPDFVRRLKLMPGVAPLALHMAILCASRSGEVRGMLWSEVSLEEGLWRIPAKRLKGHRKDDHTVPLSRQAIALLRALQHREGLVFPSTKADTPMTDMALLQVTRRMGDACVPHGFRASFSTYVTEQTDASIELREACLAHVSGDRVAAAYNRSDFLAKRRDLLQRWADMVDPS